MSKPIRVKPSFYTYCFEVLKTIAKKYGYNLVIHGSMNRDMDLILIPWVENVGNIDDLIKEFVDYLGAKMMPLTEKQMNCFPHGRTSRILNMARSGYDKNGKYFEDRLYYIDISIMPIKDAK